MLRIVPCFMLLGGLLACQEHSTLSSAPPSPRGLRPPLAATPKPAEEEDPLQTGGLMKSFSLGENRFHQASADLQINPILLPVQDKKQRAFYDEQHQEGLLKFGVQFNHPSRQGSTTTFICTQTYLYTKVNQQDLEYPFDNQEATIYLKMPDLSSIAVGKYRPALDFGPTSLQSREDLLSLHHWLHPQLCEGLFAERCRLEVKTTLNEKSTTIPGYQVSIALYLGSDQQAVFFAKTPSRGPYPQNPFGCD